MKWYSMLKLCKLSYHHLWWFIVQMCVVNVISIKNDIIKYTIQEELPMNTLIGDISRDSGITEKYSQDIIKQLKYQIITNPVFKSHKEVNLFFNVDEHAGLLKTAVQIDRDVICPRKSSCSQAVEIVISPNQYFQIIPLLVEILDTNDNVPKFDVDHIAVNVSESVEIGHVITSFPAANDPDSGVFGINGYKLENINKSQQISDIFYLKKYRKLDGYLELKIILAVKLDRETVSSYQFEVIAFEGTKTPHYGTLLLKVTVLDTNDNLPLFKERSYSIDVPENSTIKYPIVTVSAYDPDIGSNGKIIFGFSRKTTADFNHIFEIHSASGEIYVKGILDYEIKNIYRLVVTATNESPGSQTSEVSVLVNVKDINDFTPQITALNDNAKQVTVLENEPNGTFIAYISVVDMDSGHNGMVICGLDTKDFIMKQLQKDRYTIISNTILDREVVENYRIGIICSDRGNPALSSSTIIMLKVMDVNDHAPFFEKSVYTATVEENNEINSFILQVIASDQDIDNNAQVTFYLSSNNSKEINLLFQIDDNGVLRAKEVLDHEKYTSVSFEIIAQDNGNPVLTATAKVLIEILDVNDCKPTFSENSYHLKVYENQLPGTIVGNVSATDSDSYPNNIITYSLESSHKVFTINAFTGIITTKTKLDREELYIYHLQVISFNPGTPEMQSIVTLIISVLDENDNIPVIDFPNQLSHMVNIYNNVKPGFAVTSIKAHDIDTGMNAKLIYTIQEVNHVSLNNYGRKLHFIINPIIGEIKVTKQLMSKQYNITVVVKDSGSPQQTASSFLTINVKAVEGSALSPSHINYNIDGDYKSSSGINNRNARPDMSVVIAVACGITVVVVSFIIGILFMSCRRQKRQTVQRRKYDAQGETQMMLNKDTGNNRRDRDKVPEETKINQFNSDESQMSQKVVSCPRYTNIQNQVKKREEHNHSDQTNDGIRTQSTHHLHTSIVSSHEQNQFSTRIVPLTDKEIEIHKILKFLHSQDEDNISPSDSGQFTSSIGDDSDKSNAYKCNKSNTNVDASLTMTTFGVIPVTTDLVSTKTRKSKGYQETCFEDDEIVKTVPNYNKCTCTITDIQNKNCYKPEQKDSHFYNIRSEHNQAEEPCYGLMRSVSGDGNFPRAAAPYVCSSSDHSIAASDMSGSYVMRQDDEVIKLDLTGLKDTTV